MLFKIFFFIFYQFSFSVVNSFLRQCVWNHCHEFARFMASLFNLIYMLYVFQFNINANFSKDFLNFAKTASLLINVCHGRLPAITKYSAWYLQLICQQTFFGLGCKLFKKGFLTIIQDYTHAVLLGTQKIKYGIMTSCKPKTITEVLSLIPLIIPSILNVCLRILSVTDTDGQVCLNVLSVGMYKRLLSSYNSLNRCKPGKARKWKSSCHEWPWVSEMTKLRNVKRELGDGRFRQGSKVSPVSGPVGSFPTAPEGLPGWFSDANRTIHADKFSFAACLCRSRCVEVSECTRVPSLLHQHQRLRL